MCQGVEQRIRMATGYKIVVAPDTGVGALSYASSGPMVWDYNNYEYMHGTSALIRLIWNTKYELICMALSSKWESPLLMSY